MALAFMFALHQHMTQSAALFYITYLEALYSKLILFIHAAYMIFPLSGTL